MVAQFFGAVILAVGIVVVVDADTYTRQDQGIDSVFRSGVEVVRGRVMVNGRNGRAPQTLVPEDFDIRQNGIRQTISIFESFAISASRTCYEIAFTSSTPAAVKKRTVEVRVRGYSKLLKSTYTLKDESASSPLPSTGGCRSEQRE